MANFNKWIGIGNLTRDPEIRFTTSGTRVADFGFAVNRKTDTREETLFVDCVVWGKQAETIAEYLSKGSPLFIEGRLQLDQWESKSGEKRSKIRVVVERFQFLGGRDDAKAPPPAVNPADFQDDDTIPF